MTNRTNGLLRHRVVPAFSAHNTGPQDDRLFIPAHSPVWRQLRYERECAQQELDREITAAEVLALVEAAEAQGDAFGRRLGEAFLRIVERQAAPDQLFEAS